jgi:hypothetical protein
MSNVCTNSDYSFVRDVEDTLGDGALSGNGEPAGASRDPQPGLAGFEGGKPRRQLPAPLIPVKFSLRGNQG